MFLIIALANQGLKKYRTVQLSSHDASIQHVPMIIT